MLGRKSSLFLRFFSEALIILFVTLDPYAPLMFGSTFSEMLGKIDCWFGLCCMPLWPTCLYFLFRGGDLLLICFCLNFWRISSSLSVLSLMSSMSLRWKASLSLFFFAFYSSKTAYN